MLIGLPIYQELFHFSIYPLGHFIDSFYDCAIASPRVLMSVCRRTNSVYHTLWSHTINNQIFGLFFSLGNWIPDFGWLVLPGELFAPEPLPSPFFRLKPFSSVGGGSGE